MLDIKICYCLIFSYHLVGIISTSQGIRPNWNIGIIGFGLRLVKAYSSEREPTTWGRGRRICLARKGNMARISTAG